MCCDGAKAVCITVDDMKLRLEAYERNKEGKFFLYSSRITKELYLQTFSIMWLWI